MRTLLRNKSNKRHNPHGYALSWPSHKRHNRGVWLFFESLQSRMATRMWRLLLLFAGGVSAP